MYSYLTDNEFVNKNKMHRTCVTKPGIEFQDCSNCLKNQINNIKITWEMRKKYRAV